MHACGGGGCCVLIPATPEPVCLEKSEIRRIDAQLRAQQRSQSIDRPMDAQLPTHSGARWLCCSVALLLHTLGPSPSPSQFESKDETDDGSDTDTTRQLLIDLASPSHRLDTTGQDSIMAGPRMSGYEAASPDLATASTSLLPIAPIKPTPLHPLEEDPPLVLQHTRSSTQSFGADRRQTPDDEPQNGMCRLPKRAPDEDAQAARDKLDRIAKAQQAKHNWAKSTASPSQPRHSVAMIVVCADEPTVLLPTTTAATVPSTTTRLVDTSERSSS